MLKPDFEPRASVAAKVAIALPRSSEGNRCCICGVITKNKYCSPVCRAKRYPVRTCKMCARELPPGCRNKTCSPECADKALRRRRKLNATRACEYCGVIFAVKKSVNRRFCSIACKRAAGAVAPEISDATMRVIQEYLDEGFGARAIARQLRFVTCGQIAGLLYRGKLSRLSK